MTAVWWIASLGALIVLPAYAAARGAGPWSRTDATERAAYAFGGVAILCWCAWVGGQLGTGRLGVIVGSAGMCGLLIACSPSDQGAASASGAVPPVAPNAARAVWMGALVMAALVAVPFLPYGWDAADGVHRMSMGDWYKHLSVATALDTGSFPPANPFLIDAGPAPYYYGFHLLAAPFLQLGADAFPLLLGWTLVTAAAFPLVLYVVTLGLFGNPRSAAIAAIGGSLLVGFDLVVWLTHALDDVLRGWPLEPGMAGIRALVPSAHLDFWLHHNERQFNPPYVTAIWAPQHLAAVLLTLLIVHRLQPGRDVSTRSMALPVLWLAVLPALSAYVAVAFGVAVAIAIAAEGWWQRCAPWRTEPFARWSRVALPAAVLAIPIVGLLVNGGGTGRIAFGLSSAGGLLNGAVFSAVFGDGLLTRLLDTPMVYGLELGLVGVLAWIGVRERIRLRQVTAGQRQVLFIVAALVLLVTFVRPPVGEPNNLYARPMLIIWSLLAGFAADAWVRTRHRPAWVLLATGVCIAGTIVAAAGATAEGLLFGATSRETVNAARWINAHTDRDAVVAFTPPNRRFGYWLRRQTVAADRRHALLFGATDSRYDAVVQALDVAYASPGAADAHARFTALGADVVVVALPLPAWAEPPCFEVGYEGGDLAVVTSSQSGCAPPLPR